MIDRKGRGLVVAAIFAALVGIGALRHAIEASLQEDNSDQVEDLQKKVAGLTDKVDELELKLGDRE